MSSAQPAIPSMRPVDLDAVERELDNLWRETNTSVAASGGNAYSRNSVLTLVSFLPAGAQPDRIFEAIHRLSTSHPSRAVVVVANERQAEAGLRAAIGTYVAPESTCYGEDILLEASGDAVAHLPGAVLPLIVSGLPAFLWWLGEPPWGTALLESLVDGVDRLIVDTSEMPRVERSLTALDDLMRRKKSRCAISDISWTAQAPWREITAQFFDPANLRPYLEQIERVVIEFAAGDEDAPTNPSQAYLFAGWLSSRLNWQSELSQHSPTMDDSREHILHDPNGRKIVMKINARFDVPQQSWWERPAPAGPASSSGHHPAPQAATSVRNGALMSVHIESRAPTARATFTVAREHDLVHATTRCNVPEGSPPSQTVHLDSIGEGSPLGDQLLMFGQDVIYQAALGAAAHFIRPSLRRGMI
ncbi:MAG TPA: glucose-6-phosphate dehydrogenase assembly protein OpcA [Ktedonobacterales bacterium]|nr:glucose-6-phosphate dehydrogenase assembly protein OpcA [Ktedonobacterales bacterium]